MTCPKLWVPVSPVGSQVTSLLSDSMGQDERVITQKAEAWFSSHLQMPGGSPHSGQARTGKGSG
jgi:hypothetical protein